MSRTEGVALDDVVERVLSAYSTISRWSARDFKRRAFPAELTATQLAILHRVDKSPGITMSQLAERLDLSTPTVVRAVDALERKQFVVRRRSARDRREVEMEITPAGAEARSALDAARRERLLRLLGDMSEDEIAGLLMGFEGLARATERADAGRRVV